MLRRSGPRMSNVTDFQLLDMYDKKARKIWTMNVKSHESSNVGSKRLQNSENVPKTFHLLLGGALLLEEPKRHIAPLKLGGRWCILGCRHGCHTSDALATSKASLRPLKDRTNRIGTSDRKHLWTSGDTKCVRYTLWRVSNKLRMIFCEVYQTHTS